MPDQVDKLVILWTSQDKEVAQKMVFMYAKNSKLRDWWGQVRLIIWGPSARLMAADAELQEELEELKRAGVELQACKACADQYGVSEKLADLGVEVIFMGLPLTNYLKGDWESCPFDFISAEFQNNHSLRAREDMIPYCSICWDVDKIKLLDQRKLPREEIYLDIRDYREVIEAIKTLAIRGAPAIGVAAAMGAALGALEIQTDDGREFQRRFLEICREIAAARPTAVNLFWALDRVQRLVQDHADEPVPALKDYLVIEAQAMLKEDETSTGGWARPARS